MTLARRVQVFIGAEASDALDTLSALYGSQREAIEKALLSLVDGRGNWAVKDAITKAHEKPIRPHASLDAVGPTAESGRGKASVETVRLPLQRERIVSIPKPGKNKDNK